MPTFLCVSGKLNSYVIYGWGFHMVLTFVGGEIELLTMFSPVKVVFQGQLLRPWLLDVSLSLCCADSTRVVKLSDECQTSLIHKSTCYDTFYPLG